MDVVTEQIVVVQWHGVRSDPKVVVVVLVVGRFVAVLCWLWLFLPQWPHPSNHLALDLVHWDWTVLSRVDRETGTIPFHPNVSLGDNQTLVWVRRNGSIGWVIDPMAVVRGGGGGFVRIIMIIIVVVVVRLLDPQMNGILIDEQMYVFAVPLDTVPFQSNNALARHLVAVGVVTVGGRGRGGRRGNSNSDQIVALEWKWDPHSRVPKRGSLPDEVDVTAIGGQGR